MGDHTMEQLRAEQGRILAMPGRTALVKLRRLGRAGKIFRGNADFREEYQRRIDEEFKAAPLHRFIIDLRQLI